jgi:hypothetical protein
LSDNLCCIAHELSFARNGNVSSAPHTGITPAASSFMPKSLSAGPEQEVGEIGAILPGDPGDERHFAGHVADLSIYATLRE